LSNDEDEEERELPSWMGVREALVLRVANAKRPVRERRMLRRMMAEGEWMEREREERSMP